MNPPVASDTPSRAACTTSVERDAAARRADPDRPAPATGDRAGPRSRRWRRRAPPSAAAASSSESTSSAPSATASCDVTPIFSARLSDESGESRTGAMRDRRQLRHRAGEALLHDLARRQKIGPRLEDQHDRRKPEHRLRANDLHAGHAGERRSRSARSRALRPRASTGPALRSGFRRWAARTPERRREGYRESAGAAAITVATARTMTTGAWRSDRETSQLIMATSPRRTRCRRAPRRRRSRRSALRAARA